MTPLAFLLLFFWQPDYMRILFEDSLGRIMLGTAIVLEIVGIMWVMRLLRTD